MYIFDFKGLLCMTFADDKPIKNESDWSTVSIHVVTCASQLPAEFLQPSSERQLVIGFDCEGVDLCRSGTLCVMQVFQIF